MQIYVTKRDLHPLRYDLQITHCTGKLVQHRLSEVSKTCTTELVVPFSRLLAVTLYDTPNLKFALNLRPYLIPILF